MMVAGRAAADDTITDLTATVPACMMQHKKHYQAWDTPVKGRDGARGWGKSTEFLATLANPIFTNAAECMLYVHIYIYNYSYI